MSMDNNLDTWKRIVFKRMNSLYQNIQTPAFLETEANRIKFISAIENYILNQIKGPVQAFNRRTMLIYGILLPLERHFNKEEEQTFITKIDDMASMNYALSRIKNRDYQRYRTEKRQTTQCIPISAIRNYDGVGVGKGLKIPGTIQYWCTRCKKYVGFTPEAYWDHQKRVHDNPRVKAYEMTIRENQFKF